MAPSLQLEDLLLLGARLDDLLLPWRFDLQLQHRIDHPGLLAHIERVGVALLHSPATIASSDSRDPNRS